MGKDIVTPPGTGTVTTLNAEQKDLLKELWREIFAITDSGKVDIPASESNSEVPSPTASPAPVAAPAPTATVKKSWFSSSSSSSSVSTAADTPASKTISLAEIGLTVDQLRPTLWNNILGDHPDTLILRFLRARKWNVANGLTMCLKAMKWRLDADLEGLKAKSEDELNELYKGFRLQMELGKSYIHGTDKDGRPVVYINVRLHKPADQSAEALEKFTVYVMETGRLMLQPPVETAALVFDMTGFGLSNMDYSFVKVLVQLFEAYYPESLGVLCIHKAPLVFWGVWKVIEPWLDPVVASKIRFTRTDQDLLEVIPAGHLPVKYGGGEDKFKYEYVPVVPGENDRMKDTETKEKFVDEWKALMYKFEAVTREWVSNPTEKDAKKRADAEIEAERTQLAKEVREAYYKMEPYIRARNMYHRGSNPVLQPSGDIHWTYQN